MFGQDDGYPAPGPVSDEDIALMKAQILMLSENTRRSMDKMFLQDIFNQAPLLEAMAMLERWES